MPIETTRAAGLFSDRQSAQTALTKLHDSGFDMNKVSVVNKNSETGDISGASLNSKRPSKKQR